MKSFFLKEPSSCCSSQRRLKVKRNYFEELLTLKTLKMNSVLLKVIQKSRKPPLMNMFFAFASIAVILSSSLQFTARSKVSQTEIAIAMAEKKSQVYQWLRVKTYKKAPFARLPSFWRLLGFIGGYRMLTCFDPSVFYRSWWGRLKEVICHFLHRLLWSCQDSYWCCSELQFSLNQPLRKMSREWFLART